MDINSILSFGIGEIYSNYDMPQVGKVANTKVEIMQKVDSYEPDTRSSIMKMECYDYSKMLFSKGSASMEKTVTQSSEEIQQGGQAEGISGGSGASSGEDSEAKVETEVKVINGQAYMTIKTTAEDGTVTIRNIKLGGITSKGNVDRNFDSTSLADAVTL